MTTIVSMDTNIYSIHTTYNITLTYIQTLSSQNAVCSEPIYIHAKVEFFELLSPKFPA